MGYEKKDTWKSRREKRNRYGRSPVQRAPLGSNGHFWTLNSFRWDGTADFVGIQWCHDERYRERLYPEIEEGKKLAESWGKEWNEAANKSWNQLEKLSTDEKKKKKISVRQSFCVPVPHDCRSMSSTTSEGLARGVYEWGKKANEIYTFFFYRHVRPRFDTSRPFEFRKSQKKLWAYWLDRTSSISTSLSTDPRKDLWKKEEERKASIKIISWK